MEPAARQARRPLSGRRVRRRSGVSAARSRADLYVPSGARPVASGMEAANQQMTRCGPFNRSQGAVGLVRAMPRLGCLAAGRA